MNGHCSYGNMGQRYISKLKAHEEREREREQRRPIHTYSYDLSTIIGGARMEVQSMLLDLQLWEQYNY